MNLSVMLLAAGGSTRMGQPKQLLTFQGKTLLRRMGELCEALPATQRVVVLGSRSEQMKPELEGLDMEIALNPDWQRGMGSSIHTGMQQLSPSANALLMLLVDQPFVSVSLLQQMIDAAKSGSELVTALYGEVAGVPTLFSSRFFPALTALSGKGGARKLIQAHRSEATLIPFPQGKIDVDTPEDYQRLLGKES